MLEIIPGAQIFQKDYGWHTGRFHFSFGDYIDPANTGFGVLTALNDFTVQPGMGFSTHPHAEVEIISFVVQGSLIHRDNLGNENLLGPGDCQYTCTGSGITHSEMNASQDEILRFLQIWIRPERGALTPHYQTVNNLHCEDGCFCHIASGEEIKGVQQIAQDANVFSMEISKAGEAEFHNQADRQCLVLCLEGGLDVNGFKLVKNDIEKIRGREDLVFTANEKSLLLMVEMAEQ